MSSKRRQRRKQCENKARHITQDNALIAAHRTMESKLMVRKKLATSIYAGMTMVLLLNYFRPVSPERIFSLFGSGFMLMCTIIAAIEYKELSSKN